MTCTRPQAARQIPLATRAPSTHVSMQGAFQISPNIIRFGMFILSLAKKHPFTLLSKSAQLQKAAFKLLGFDPKSVQ